MWPAEDQMEFVPTLERVPFRELKVDSRSIWMFAWMVFYAGHYPLLDDKKVFCALAEAVECNCVIALVHGIENMQKKHDIVKRNLMSFLVTDLYLDEDSGYFWKNKRDDPSSVISEETIILKILAGGKLSECDEAVVQKNGLLEILRDMELFLKQRSFYSLSCRLARAQFNAKLKLIGEEDEPLDFSQVIMHNAITRTPLGLEPKKVNNAITPLGITPLGLEPKKVNSRSRKRRNGGIYEDDPPFKK